MLSHDAPIITALMRFLAGVAVPLVLFVVVPVWPESLARQLAATGAVLSLFPLALFRKKYEALLLCLLLFSQFGLSLISFSLDPPVMLQILFGDLILLLFVFVALEARIRVRLDGLGSLFLIMLVWFAIAGYFSAHQHRSYIFLLDQAKYFVIYVLALNGPLSESLSKRVVNAILWVVIVQGLIGIAQTIKGDTIGLGILGEFSPANLDGYLVKGNLRSSGTIGATNAYAGYMSMILVFLFPFVLVRRGLLLYFGFGIGVIAIILALSRAGWLSFLVGIICVILMMLRARFITLSRLMIFILAGGMAFSLAIGLYFDKVSHRFEDREAKHSAMGRVTQFSKALDVVEKHPVVGIGPGVTEFFGRWNNNHIYMKKALPDIEMPNQVHNSQLQVTIESGIPGLLIFLTMISMIFCGVLRRMKKESGANSMQFLQIGAICAAVAVMVHISFGTEFNNKHIFLVFWALLGLARNHTKQTPDKKLSPNLQSV